LNVNFVEGEKNLSVFDKKTGNPICEIPLPSNANGTPMIYLLNGKQYLILPIRGDGAPAEWVALSLP
jgi:quinoprotein glucose dehydrogenase